MTLRNVFTSRGAPWATAGLAAVVLPLVVSCSDSSAGEEPDSSAGSAVVESADLPGPEVLQPPPADATVPGLTEALASLPSGVLRGHLALTLTGTAVFDEDVTGTCGPGGTSDVAILLSDGTELVLSGEGAAAHLDVAAPGLVLGNDVSDVVVQYSGGTFDLTSTLLHPGTSESTGSFALEASCG